MFNGRSAFFQWIFHWSPFSRQGAKCWVCLKLLAPDLCQCWTTCLLYIPCSLHKCSEAQIRLSCSNQFSFHQYISFLCQRRCSCPHNTRTGHTFKSNPFRGWGGGGGGVEGKVQLGLGRCKRRSWKTAISRIGQLGQNLAVKASSSSCGLNYESENSTHKQCCCWKWVGMCLNSYLGSFFNRYIQRSTRRAELTDPVPHKLSTLQVRQAGGIQAWAEKGTAKLWDRTNEFKFDSACAIHICRWGPFLTAFHRLCGSLWSSRTNCCNGLSPIQLLCRSLFKFSDSL